MGRASNAVLTSSLSKAILNRPECHLIGIVLALINRFFRTNNPAISQTLFQSRLQNLLLPEARKVYRPRSENDKPYRLDLAVLSGFLALKNEGVVAPPVFR